MKKYVSFVAILAVALLWNLSLMGWYLSTQHEKPLILAQIPESTQQFLTELNNKLLSGGNNHFFINHVDSLDSDSWSNEGDYGTQTGTGLTKEASDTLFVFYCDDDGSALTNLARKYAYEAIEPMKQLMGQYVYPYMVKGRKLPIYLCTKEDSYQKVCSELVGKNTDYSNSWGLCVTRYSGVDVQTVGIVINYHSISAMPENADKHFKSTLWHEMNHYVYFQSLKLSSEVTPYVWVFEGLAEYFSSNVIKQTTRLNKEEKQMAMGNRLESTFSPYSYNYSGGELFYEYIDKKYGKEMVSEFVRSLYESPLPESLIEVGLNIDRCENEWKDYVSSTYLN